MEEAIETGLPYVPGVKFDKFHIYDILKQAGVIGDMRVIDYQIRNSKPEDRAVYVQLVLNGLIESGNFDLIDQVIDYLPEDLRVDMYAANKSNLWTNIAMLNRLLDLGIIMDDDDLYTAAVEGSNDILNILISRGRYTQHALNTALSYASSYGNIDTIKLLIDKGANDKVDALDAAILSKQVDVIKYFMSTGMDSDYIIDRLVDLNRQDLISHLI